MPWRIQTGQGTAVAETRLEYEAGGARVIKREDVVGGVQQTTYVDELYELVTRDGAEPTHRYRVFAGSRPVAQVTRTGSSETKVYLHDDHLGSTSAITNASGVSIETRSFKPFGQGEGAFGQDVINGFTGHEHDGEQGLINMRGRIYDPAIGRFLTADPFVTNPQSSQGWNRYAYVRNNPLNFTDPSGFSECTGAGVCAPGSDDPVLVQGNGSYQFTVEGQWDFSDDAADSKPGDGGAGSGPGLSIGSTTGGRGNDPTAVGGAGEPPASGVGGGGGPSRQGPDAGSMPHFSGGAPGTLVNPNGSPIATGPGTAPGGAQTGDPASGGGCGVPTQCAVDRASVDAAVRIGVGGLAIATFAGAVIGGVMTTIGTGGTNILVGAAFGIVGGIASAIASGGSTEDIIRGAAVGALGGAVAGALGAGAAWIATGGLATSVAGGGMGALVGTATHMVSTATGYAATAVVTGNVSNGTLVAGAVKAGAAPVGGAWGRQRKSHRSRRIDDRRRAQERDRQVAMERTPEFFALLGGVVGSLFSYVGVRLMNVRWKHRSQVEWAGGAMLLKQPPIRQWLGIGVIALIPVVLGISVVLRGPANPVTLPMVAIVVVAFVGVGALVRAIGRRTIAISPDAVELKGFGGRRIAWSQLATIHPTSVQNPRRQVLIFRDRDGKAIALDSTYYGWEEFLERVSEIAPAVGSKVARAMDRLEEDT